MKLSFGFAAGAIAVAALAAAFHARPSAPQVPALSVAAGSAEPVTFPKARVKAAPLVVYVAGEVARSGLYRFADGARIDDAVRAAGGFTARADRLATDLAEPLHDGEEVLIAPAGAVDPYAAVAGRAQGASQATSATRSRRRPRRPKARGAGSRHRSRKPLPAVPVDLNAAGASELATLPGIGAGLAARIVTFRETNGPFATLDDVLDVAGMTQSKLDAIDPYARLGSMAPRAP